MLILESPWTRQPQTYTQARYDANLCNGLTGLYSQAMRYPIDATGKSIVSRVGADLLPTDRGMATHFYSSNHLSFGDKRFSSLSQGAALVVFRTASFATQRVLVYEASAANNNYAVLIPTTSTSPVVVNLGSNTSRNTTKASWVANQWYSMLTTWGASGLDIYIDGVFDSNHAAATSTGVSNQNLTLSGYWLSNDARGQNAVDAEILLFASWSRFLSAGEAATLYVNPWQLFAPQQIIIPTPAAAGYTHPTLSLATATEITATGFKPRVTYTFA